MTSEDFNNPPALVVLNPNDCPLHDGVIGLRPFCHQDAEGLHEAIQESCDTLCATMTWCRADYSLQDCEQFIAKCGTDWLKGLQYNFAVVTMDEGLILGSAGINQVNPRHNFANIGYWIRSQRTRRGAATAAARLISRFGLEELGFDRLEFLVAESNAASHRVAHKVRAKAEGILRKRLIVGGKAEDATMYSLVREDLAAAVCV